MKNLHREEWGIVAAVTFFLVFAIAGLNIGVWRHNPSDPWQAVAWLNGLLTSWGFPLVVWITLFVVTEMRNDEDDVE